MAGPIGSPLGAKFASDYHHRTVATGLIECFARYLRYLLVRVNRTVRDRPVGTEPDMMDETYDGAVFPDNRNVVLTNHGRTAFEKILQLRGLSGARVVVPAFLCADGFERIFRRYDLDPVFVDVNPRTYHMDFDRARHEAPDADAILLNHAFGVPADATRWRALADESGATLIEDCARALGAFVDGRPVGGFGEFAIYSLKKVSPVVEGGALATTIDPSEIALDSPTYDVKQAYALLPRRYKRAVERVYETTTDARSPTESGSEYDHSTVLPRALDAINTFAFCYHLTGGFRNQLARNVAAARAVRDSLKPLGFEFQETRGRCPFHFVAMVVPGNRDETVSRLRETGIFARKFWDPPLVTALDEGRRLSEFPNTKRLVEDGLQLPLVEMSTAEVSRAIDVIEATAPTRQPTPSDSADQSTQRTPGFMSVLDD